MEEGSGAEDKGGELTGALCRRVNPNLCRAMGTALTRAIFTGLTSQYRSLTCVDQNITRARKEIDRLEAEAEAANPSKATANGNTNKPPRTHDSAKKLAEKQQAVNGTADVAAEATQEADAMKDVEKEMEEAKLEDKEAEEGGA